MVTWALVAVALSAPEMAVEGAKITVGQGPGPEITIAATSARWDLAHQRGVLEGDVVAIQGDLRLRCDAAEVELDAGAGIRKASAHGSVEVTQGDKVATADRAVLEAGRLELTGNPSLKTPEHEMSGSKIVFVVGEQAVECEDCTVRLQPQRTP